MIDKKIETFKIGHTDKTDKYWNCYFVVNTVVIDSVKIIVIWQWIWYNDCTCQITSFLYFLYLQ